MIVTMDYLWEIFWGKNDCNFDCSLCLCCPYLYVNNNSSITNVPAIKLYGC